MSKPPRPRNAARRASFGRAERLRREADNTRHPRPDTTRKTSTHGRTDRAAKQEARPYPARGVDYDRRLTSLHRVEERLERSRTALERRRQTRLKDQTRTAFNERAERRQEAERRAEYGRKQEALQQKTRRIEEHRCRANLRRLERKRGEMKREFARLAERRRDMGRRIEQERMRERARGEIEHRHKRQLADQQVEHRRQTSELRTRHQAETRSLRSNESAALERHHHAVRNIDEREGRALDDFDARRNSLTGRLAERIPGRCAENDQKRADLRSEFEAERLTKHRDLEALKERQFDVAQKARLQQARERKASMDGHRTDRAQLADRQKADRPRLIEGQTRALVRAERERSHEAEQVRKEPEREQARPAPAFARM